MMDRFNANGQRNDMIASCVLWVCSLNRSCKEARSVVIGVGRMPWRSVGETQPAIQRDGLLHRFECFEAHDAVAGLLCKVDGALHQRMADALTAQRRPHIQPAHFGHALVVLCRLQQHAAGDLRLSHRQQHRACRRRAFSRKLHELRIEAVESPARAGGFGQCQRCLAVFAQQQPNLIELKFVAGVDNACAHGFEVIDRIETLLIAFILFILSCD